MNFISSIAGNAEEKIELLEPLIVSNKKAQEIVISNNHLHSLADEWGPFLANFVPSDTQEGKLFFSFCK